MRTAFINSLMDMADKNADIFLITGDLGFSVLERFAAMFPERFINAGIAEGNMIGIAAGLAMSGKIVYVYSIIPFLIMRCFEQIRVDLCYQNLDVKLVGTGGGMSYGAAGATHHAIEDIGIMRTLPNMKVICPGDPYEAEEAVRAASCIHGPVYIRLNKNNEPRLYDRTPEFTIGSAIKVKDGSGVGLIATGNMLVEAVKISCKLKENNISSIVLSMHTVKPIDEEAIKDCCSKSDYIFTLEEHSIYCGLGSAVAEVLLKIPNKLKGFKSYGIPDCYADCSGSSRYFRKKYGIDDESITADIMSILERNC